MTRSILLALTLAACGDDMTVSIDAQLIVPRTGPHVIATAPAAGDVDVPLNARLSATFDMAMQPLDATTFTLSQGTIAIPGAIATAPGGAIATFAPMIALAPSTVFTATITTGATSLGGDALGTAASWTFTTGTTIETTAPTVSATIPDAGATGVATNTAIAATFDEAMDPFSITPATFTVKQGATVIAGTVSYGPGTTANFTPASALPVSTLLTATLAVAITDLQGNALAAPFAWSFTTGTTTGLGPAPVGLGSAGNFVVLAKTAISTVPDSVLNGDIGVSPVAATAMTGFGLVADPTNVFSTSPQINGKAYAADYAVPTPANLTTAIHNMESAFTDAASRPTPDFLELGTGDLGGKTLAPGLYKWTSSVTIPADVTISGGANDVWIFQTTGDLAVSATKKVVLAGGAQAKNIFWEVAGHASFGATSHFEGILICKTDVTMQTGATMIGRILAQTQVALQKATVTRP